MWALQHSQVAAPLHSWTSQPYSQGCDLQNLTLPPLQVKSPSFSCSFPSVLWLPLHVVSSRSVIALEVQRGGNMPRRAQGSGAPSGECAALLHHFHVCWSRTEFSVLMINFFSLWEEANWQFLSPSPNLSLFYCLLTRLALPFPVIHRPQWLSLKSGDFFYSWFRAGSVISFLLMDLPHVPLLERSGLAFFVAWMFLGVVYFRTWCWGLWGEERAEFNEEAFLNTIKDPCVESGTGWG